MTRKDHEREIEKLGAAHRRATASGDKDSARLFAAEMVRHAIAQDEMFPFVGDRHRRTD